MGEEDSPTQGVVISYRCRYTGTMTNTQAYRLLWGIPPWGGWPIKANGGTSAECSRKLEQRKAEGWRGLVVLRVGQPYDPAADIAPWQGPNAPLAR